MTWPAPPAAGSGWRLLVGDLVVEASIGIYAHERRRRQRVRISLALDVDGPATPPGAPDADDIGRVVSYEPLVEGARRLAAAGHVNLVETLAERLAAMCLSADPRIATARVRVEKLDVFADVGAVGVEIVRSRPGAA